jgi:hypothetical protein
VSLLARRAQIVRECEIGEAELEALANQLRAK